MSDKNLDPQYLTADGRFTNKPPAKYEVRQLSEGAAKKAAGVLHIMLNDKSKS